MPITDASGNTVTVMSDEQVTQLITALTESIVGLKTAIVTELSTIKSNLGIANTNLENLTMAVNNLAAKLETDITPHNLSLEYGDKTGVRSIAFIEASKHVLNLKRIKDNEEEDENTDNEEESNSSESGEDIAVDEGVRQNASKVFDSLSTYEFDITDGERISFKTPESFESSKKGLAFDYTRWYCNSCKQKTDSIDEDETSDVFKNTKIDEYALLVFDSHVKTSGKTGSTDINRMKTWIDYKQIQTVVIIMNTISSKCIVYFPTQEKFNELDLETYKSEKEAMDAIVAKYQDMIGDQYKGIVFIPVSSIEPGITLEEYRTAAKNITPSCEYM